MNIALQVNGLVNMFAFYLYRFSCRLNTINLALLRFFFLDFLLPLFKRNGYQPNLHWKEIIRARIQLFRSSVSATIYNDISCHNS